ncbi:response regulator [Urechidicola croceus]|uniref:DNA-binding response regulator n=1 Tax=Urechidicola croceus TaxID=1850246 RepID=A0A1D8P4L2_9FLAO|nr:response regulator transcription factor [Urechidicola croceus]AOW19532.1 DNA-binding response regulator [Urechidicola croceus]
MIQIAIAEDHQSLIDGIELLLRNEENISIVGTANDGEELIEIVRRKKPQIVITDIRMPKIDGIAATKIIKKEFPDIKIIAFTMFSEENAIIKMMDAGASGYLLKNSSLNDVLEAIKQVFTGEKYFGKNVNINAIDNSISKPKGVLSKRQLEILSLVGQGKTSREIAEELFIGVQTVDTHRKNMIRILGLHGKGELLRYAVERKYEF